MREEEMTDQQDPIEAAHEAYFNVPLHIQAQIAADIIDKVKERCGGAGDPLVPNKFGAMELRRLGRKWEAEEAQRREAEAAKAREVENLAIELRRQYFRLEELSYEPWSGIDSDSKDNWRNVAQYVLARGRS